MSKSKLESPLAKARGHGSAKSGVHHFLVERLSGLALIPLGLWFALSLLCCLLDGSVTSIVAWLDSPLSAALMTLFIVFSFVHSTSGVQVIIEDYVSGQLSRPILLILNKTLHILFGLLCLMAIFNLHFMHSVVS